MSETRAGSRRKPAVPATGETGRDLYRLMFENNPDTLILARPDGSILAANPAACRMFGRSEAELRRLGRAAVVDTHDPRLAAALAVRAIAGEFKGELTCVRADGSHFAAEVTSRIFNDLQGTPTSSILVRDVTERRLAEDALQQAEQRSRRHAEELAVLNAVTTAATHSLDVTILLPEVCRLVSMLTGYTAVLVYLTDEVQGQVKLGASWGVAPEDEARLQRWKLGEGLTGNVAQTGDLLFGDYAAEPQVEPRWVPVEANWHAYAILPLRVGPRILGTLNLVTREQRSITTDELRLLQTIAGQVAVALDNARLFEQVLTGRERLQALSQRLVVVQEAERRFVAGELHDQVGQLLTGLKLVLEMAARAPADTLAGHLQDAQTLASDLVNRVRQLSLDLRPAMLDDLGLLPALRWHLQQYQSHTGIAVSFKHSGIEGRRFPPEVETAVYRIIQEALNNVVRYAGVQEAAVRAWVDAATLGVQVADRGAGFNVASALGSGKTTGLPGMQERAILLGGHLVVESEPGCGTCLTAELPLGRPNGESRGEGDTP